jgi:hypothetical protein
VYTFQKKHGAKFRLQLCERDSVSGAVKSCMRFCAVFGRKENVGVKSKATGHIKYFETFQTDHDIQRLTQQLSQKWSGCAELDGT